MIALVVTIVVLLILAGITITYVMGDNSVFKQAVDAKLKTDIAIWKDKLELAKGPIIVEGLGTFNPDRYFEYIEEQETIHDKDTDVIDNGDGTYDIITKPGYIFEVTLIPSQDNPKDAEITYLGQDGKIAPIIKRIETSSTKTSITAKAIVTRLGNGIVTYYYKLKSEPDSEYKEITNVNEETGATQNTGIEVGETYIIKVIAKNEVGETIDVAEIAAAKILVESITLNETSETLYDNQTVLQLTATVLPNDATNKAVVWSSSNENVAIVNENGLVTKKAEGTTIITVKATDGSNKAATCEIIVTNESNWPEIAEIAKEIAGNNSITSSSTEATVMVNGKSETIKVGDTYTLKYNGKLCPVRVLGFKHDDLVNRGVYGGNHLKAGISFEFKYQLTNYSSVNISEGWPNSKIRMFLEGEDGREKLSNNRYIKQVKKEYIKIYNNASTNNNYSNDYLWLLSASEIWNNGYNGGNTRGYAITTEGTQYQYYKKINPIYNKENINLQKVSYQTISNWWLRSPSYEGDGMLCYVEYTGKARYGTSAYGNSILSPGFCI